jgi:hypothetical protein
MLFVDDGINFPITDSLFFIDNYGPIIDEAPIFNRPLPVRAAITFAVFYLGGANAGIISRIDFCLLK